MNTTTDEMFKSQAVNTTSDEMFKGLVELQAVKTYDYAAAYYAAYGGLPGLSQPLSSFGADWIRGRTLALKVWTTNMSNTLMLRDES